MVRLDAADAHGEVVEIPLADRDLDTPAVLSSPLPDFTGVWHRESVPDEQPARYVQVEP